MSRVAKGTNLGVLRRTDKEPEVITNKTSRNVRIIWTYAKGRALTSRTTGGTVTGVKGREEELEKSQNEAVAKSERVIPVQHHGTLERYQKQTP